MTTETTPASPPISENLLAECRTANLGDWLPGPWTQDPIEGNGDTMQDHYVVKAADGTVVATLPHWAGSVALLLTIARDGLPALLAEVERLKAVEANAQKLVSAWLRASGEHISISTVDAVRDTPLIAGMQEGRANQYSDCANELRDVLNGEDPDGWEFGISVEVTATEGGEPR